MIKWKNYNNRHIVYTHCICLLAHKYKNMIWCMWYLYNKNINYTFYFYKNWKSIHP